MADRTHTTHSDIGFLGRGWAFPIRPDRHGRLHFLSGEDKIRQSLWLLLSTAPGERIMRPDFGCGIHDLTFEPNTVTLRGIVRERVLDTLIAHEPRIDVLEVRVESPEDQPNRLDIEIDYRVRDNNALFNLVYPFYLTEGVD